MASPVTLEEVPDPLGRAAGDPLDAGRHDAQTLARIKHVSGGETGRTWPALWQQTPRKTGGNLLSRTMFDLLTVCPPLEREARGWDTAYTLKETAKGDPDWSAGVRGGIWHRDPNYSRIVINHLVLKQDTWPEIHKLIRTTAYGDGRDCRIGIGGGGATSAIQDLYVDQGLMGYSIRVIPERLDKVTRAQSWIDRVQAGWFAVVEGPWNAAFFDHLEGFPYAKHDDVPDALTDLWEMLFTADDGEVVDFAQVDRIDLSAWDSFGDDGGSQNW